MVRTRTDEVLAEAEHEYADDPQRADMLARARRFKSSWLELGEALTELRRSGQWKNWGHDSFEEYARKELHLRSETVDKLTASYGFLARSAPAVLQRNGLDQPIPSYQSVDFLRRAEEEDAAPPEAMSELRRRVIDDAAPLPALSRKYREVVFPVDEGNKKNQNQLALRNAARRLAELLTSCADLPHQVVHEAHTAIDRLLVALSETDQVSADDSHE